MCIRDRHIGHDFAARTINNKITAGYSRKQIYLTETGISAVCSSVLFIVDIIFIFICSSMEHLEFGDHVTYISFILNAVISLLCLITISTLFTMIVMITHKPVSYTHLDVYKRQALFRSYSLCAF